MGHWLTGIKINKKKEVLLKLSSTTNTVVIIGVHYQLRVKSPTVELVKVVGWPNLGGPKKKKILMKPTENINSNMQSTVYVFVVCYD